MLLTLTHYIRDISNYWWKVMFEPNFDKSTSNTFVTQFNFFKGFEILYSIY
jgi:hypothetical protein